MNLAPLWAVFCVVFVLCVLALLGFWGYHGRSLIGVIVVGLGLALLITGAVALGRRQQEAATGASSRADKIMLMRAMQTGEAPPDRAFDQALLRTVTKRRAAGHRLPWFFTSFALVEIVFAIAGHQTYRVQLVCLWVVLTVCAWAE